MTMTFKENPYDSNGKVFIPADSESNEIPSNSEVEQFAASENGGEWGAGGGWHATGDSDEVYIEVKRK